MDVYEQIQYEIWCEKKAKECQSLTPYAIASAFGPEAMELIPKINRIISRRLRPLTDQLEALHEAARFEKWDKFKLDFLLDITLMLSGKQNEILLMEKNKLILSFARRAKTTTDNPKSNPVNADTIAAAKAVPITSLYSFEKTKKNSNRLMAICPFHNEKSSSFVVYLDQNKYHCYSCSANGTSIDFFMKLHNVSFYEAVKGLL